MTRTTRPRTPHLTRVPQGSAPSGHIQPTAAQRAAADAFLHGEPVDTAIAIWLDQALAGFDEVDLRYIDEARRRGADSAIWDTTGWIIANAIAREATTPS